MSFPSNAPPLFFLSYAHYPPSPEAKSPANHAVARFYADLCQTLGTLKGQLQPVRGFFDAELPPDADTDAARASALDVARVFLPLYSPAYFHDPVSTGEYARYRSQPSDLAPTRILPVLWTPFAPGEHTAETQAALRVVTEADYAENGLRALCMLGTYRRSYTAVVDRFADQLTTTLT